MAILSSVSLDALVAATDSAPKITDWLVAIGTIGTGVVAVVLAIWSEELRRLFRQPRLVASVTMDTPDCHPLTRRIDGESIDGYYFRLNVHNHGKQRARDVLVRIVALERMDDNGDYGRDPTFRPFNLRWAHIGDVMVPRIDPGLSRHCDLCHVWHLPDRDLLLELDTEVEPTQLSENVWPTKKLAGNYRLTIAVTATNAKPFRTTFQIEFSGRWFNDPAEMFERGLVISAG